MVDIAGTRAGLVAALEAAFTDAGRGDVAVTGDPRQIVPPCVFVDMLTLESRESRCVWSGTCTVHLIAPPDPDAAGLEWLDELAGIAMAALEPVVTDLTGQPFTGIPGTVGLPEYGLTVSVTVALTGG
jgi:hypothetical protein